VREVRFWEWGREGRLSLVMNAVGGGLLQNISVIRIEFI